MAFKMKNPMMGARAKMAGDPRAAMKMKSALKRTDIKLINVDDMGNEQSREISKEEFQDIRNMTDQEYTEKYGGTKPNITTQDSKMIQTDIGATGKNEMDRYTQDSYSDKIVLTGEDVTEFKETQTDRELADNPQEIKTTGDLIKTEGFDSGKPNEPIASTTLSESEQKTKLVGLFSEQMPDFKESQISFRGGKPFYKGRPITYKMLDNLEDKKLSAQYKSRQGGDK